MNTAPLRSALKLRILVPLCGIILHSSSGILHAQVPQILNYQGRVAVGTPAVNFDGSGAFKFALVQGTGPTLLWKNDGSSGNTEPTAAVTLPVTKGLYSVLLGANMTPIPNSVFANADVRLRVWFNDGTNGSQLLTPDQRLAAVGYAMIAGGVNLPTTTSATSGVITQAGVPLIHSFGSQNFFAGVGAGNFTMTGAGNVGIGAPALSSLTTGGSNMAMGLFALNANTTGGANTAIGSYAQVNNDTGSSNTALGFYTLVDNKGSNNIAIGRDAGNVLTTGSNNVVIGHVGVAGDANIIRIGTPGTQTDTYLTGVIRGDGAGLTNIPASAVATPPPGMVLIPAGAFTMGNSVAADTDITNAAPVSTTVSAFYMDVNEVTLSQWQSVYYWATSNGYAFAAGAGKGPNHPVQTVTWYDVVMWCNARSEQAGKTPVYYTNDAQTTIYKTGNVNVTNAQVKWTVSGYRLPTEAEWEKAARGGRTGQRFPWGNTITQNLANYYGATASYAYDLGPNGYNAIGSIGGTSPATSPAGSFALNGYGLNDMAGNVFEWCWDWYGTPYAGGTDPRGASTGSYRVIRGESWGGPASCARCANRNGTNPDNASTVVGFRAVLAPGQP